MIPTTHPRFAFRRLLACALLGLSSAVASAADLQEPITIASHNGLLDVLMVARAAAVPDISVPGHTTQGWVYEICRRPANNADSCPSSTGESNYYGGTRLALMPGDKLKIRLVNKLPPGTDFKHAEEADMGFLSQNPTNIHTHGLLVSPRNALGTTTAAPPFGDNVFVMTFNPANGPLPPQHHLDMMNSVGELGASEYEIDIPASHPPGLYWFHPHIHGISYNQMSAGLAGIITIGKVPDYVCTDPMCLSSGAELGVRHMLLKDSQVLADGTLQDQPDPNFCLDVNGNASPLAPGHCAGQNQGDGLPDYTGGKWFLTVNGSRYPNVPVSAPAGEIWRITNTSGSVAYDLRLVDPAHQREMIVQVLSIDGVSVSATAGSSLQSLKEITGGKIHPVSCPGVRGGGPEPLCTTRLRMMPSSRAEIWVTWRDANGIPVPPPAGAQLVFRTAGVQTGPDGDSWPGADLASVQFASSGVAGSTLPAALSVKSFAAALTAPAGLSADLGRHNAAVVYDPRCKPLPAGHMRRIFFNAPVEDPDAFGLGYEELDAAGNPVPGTFQDVKPFDPTTPTVCVQLGPRNSAVTERWQLVNLAAEDHNFHIHQTKFRVLSVAELDGTGIPGRNHAKGVLMDNVPLLHADSPTDEGCADVDTWRRGECTAHPATVEIPFAIAGDFVYHCHILEHEDGGMMAVIRVRRSGQ